MVRDVCSGPISPDTSLARAVEVGHAKIAKKQGDAVPDSFSESHKIETYKSMITVSIEVFKMLEVMAASTMADVQAIV